MLLTALSGNAEHLLLGAKPECIAAMQRHWAVGVEPLTAADERTVGRAKVGKLNFTIGAGSQHAVPMTDPCCSFRHSKAVLLAATDGHAACHFIAFASIITKHTFHA